MGDRAEQAPEWIEEPEDVARRKAELGQAGSQPPRFTPPPATQPMGAERYVESRLAASGTLSNGGKAGRGVTYQDGPYKGMTPGQAEEAARKDYAKMGDEERQGWEKDAQGETLRSDRERETAASNQIQENQAYGFAPPAQAPAPSATGSRPAAGNGAPAGTTTDGQSSFAPSKPAGSAMASAGMPSATDSTRNAQASTAAQAGTGFSSNGAQASNNGPQGKMAANNRDSGGGGLGYLRPREQQAAIAGTDDSPRKKALMARLDPTPQQQAQDQAGQPRPQQGAAPTPQQDRSTFFAGAAGQASTKFKVGQAATTATIQGQPAKGVTPQQKAATPTAPLTAPPAAGSKGPPGPTMGDENDPFAPKPASKPVDLKKWSGLSDEKLTANKAQATATVKAQSYARDEKTRKANLARGKNAVGKLTGEANAASGAEVANATKRRDALDEFNTKEYGTNPMARGVAFKADREATKANERKRWIASAEKAATKREKANAG